MCSWSPHVPILQTSMNSSLRKIEVKVTDAVIEVKGLSHSYPDKPLALAEVGFSVLKGDLLIVVGHNGAGKSTLFKCLSGLLDFTSGSITWRLGDAEQTLTPQSHEMKQALRRRIGVIFQDPALWPHLTALENVALPLADVHGKTERDAQKDAKHWLVDMLGLRTQLLSAYPFQLSGGEKRRVAIARVFAIEPEVLLLDEVTPHLDPLAVENVLGIVKRHFIDLKKTVVMITHRADMLFKSAREIMVIENGRLAEEATPMDVIGRRAGTNSIIHVLTDPGRGESIQAAQSLETAIQIVSDALSDVEPHGTF